ncbi:ribose-phosphate diphosphokinase [Dyella japonica]|uniref:Ribose-phosphate pyrophosphokinase n=1 Tax=Dyella japonica TaxID=231455 RepID=A0ABV2JQQ4_9GAMM
MNRLIYTFPGNDDLSALLALRCHRQTMAMKVHGFPDGETLVTVQEPTAGADIVLVCTLDHPDAKLAPLLMAADTLREFRPRRLTLVAAYLPYMRQDARFHPGEAVTSRLFGSWLGAHFDVVVTVDPHLHRHATLTQVGIRNGIVAHAAAPIAAWIRRHVRRPVIVGPDSESLPWVSDVAARLAAPHFIASKRRADDTHVRLSLPAEAASLVRTFHPVLLDDIVSSGCTMAECVRSLLEAGSLSPTCIAIHGVFAPGARELISQVGADMIVTTNTIEGRESRIDISGSLAAAMESIPLLETAEHLGTLET